MLRDFLERLFPADLVAYVPGAKWIAAALTAAIAFAQDVLGGVEIPAEAYALIPLAAQYLWPEREDVELEDQLVYDVEPDDAAEPPPEPGELTP